MLLHALQIDAINTYLIYNTVYHHDKTVKMILRSTPSSSADFSGKMSERGKTRHYAYSICSRHCLCFLTWRASFVLVLLRSASGGKARHDANQGQEEIPPP